MNTSSLFRTSLLAVILFCFSAPVGGSDEPVRGPLPEKQQKIIRFLAEHHAELTRIVVIRHDGYMACTTTDNRELAIMLKEHFSYMQRRLGRGAMVRRWDPAFVELFRFHNQLETQIDYLDDGIRVTVIGKTPEAVKVAQNHARIVTGFAEKGAAAVRERHNPVFDDN